MDWRLRVYKFRIICGVPAACPVTDNPKYFWGRLVLP